MNRRYVIIFAAVLVVGATAVYGVVAFPTDGFGDTHHAPVDADDPTATDASGEPEPAADQNDSSDRKTPYIAHNGDELTLNATSGQDVRVETALPEGSIVAVRVKSTGSSHPFIISREATVDAGGTAVATFDFCDIDLDESATVEAYVVHNGERLTNATGTVNVVESAACPTQSESESSTQFVYDGERITLESAERQTVRAETDLSAGETVSLRLRSSNSDQPFLKSNETTVRKDGTVVATFDMSDIEAGISFQASLYHDGETLAEADGRVAE